MGTVVRFGGAMEDKATERPMPVAIGDVINDRYVIDSFIGEGGVSLVFGAHSIMTDQRFALKCLKPQAFASAKIVERFAREARAALSIKSAYVVSVHDVGSLPSGPPFLVMEYLQGRDLETWRRERGRLPVRQAAEFALHMCEALAAAHSRGVVHRDIQPKNLFVAERDSILEMKVLDIGISKAALTGGAPDANLPVVKTVSLSGAAPLYISPEQLRSSAEVDGRSDIWAIGMVLYEALAGRRPFQGRTITEACAAVLQGQPFPLSEARPDIPGGFVKIIVRCLQKKPADRFQNVAELAAALTRYAPSRARASAERAADVLRQTGPIDEAALSLATVFSSNPPPHDSLVPSSGPRSSVRAPSLKTTLITSTFPPAAASAPGTPAPRPAPPVPAPAPVPATAPAPAPAPGVEPSPKATLVSATTQPVLPARATSPLASTSSAIPSTATTTRVGPIASSASSAIAVPTDDESSLAEAAKAPGQGEAEALPPSLETTAIAESGASEATAATATPSASRSEPPTADGPPMANDLFALRIFKVPVVGIAALLVVVFVALGLVTRTVEPRPEDENAKLAASASAPASASLAPSPSSSLGFAGVTTTTTATADPEGMPGSPATASAAASAPDPDEGSSARPVASIAALAPTTATTGAAASATAPASASVDAAASATAAASSDAGPSLDASTSDPP